MVFMVLGTQNHGKDRVMAKYSGWLDLLKHPFKKAQEQERRRQEDRKEYERISRMFKGLNECNKKKR